MRAIVVAVAVACLAMHARAQDAACLLPFLAHEDAFTITFLTGTPPTNIVLHASYAGPATNSAALYDPGNGVWQAYTSHNLPVVGTTVRFKGDWRTSGRVYSYMFYNTLAGAGYTCRLSGAFAPYPTHTEAYREMFRGCTKVVAVTDNPVPNLVGATATRTYSGMFYQCSGIGSLPSGLLDLSGLSGAPEAFMLDSTLAFCSGVTGSHDIKLGAGIAYTAANVSTLGYMCYGMNKWSGRVLWGTNVLAVAVPAPTADNNCFYNCTNMPGYADLNANWK